MLIYVCLFGLACSGILFEKYSRFSKETKRIVVCTVMFLAIFFTFALRHQCMGIDLHYQNPKTGYLHSFDELTGMPWSKVIRLEKYQNYERGYIIFNKFIGMINPSRQFFMACCAFCSIAPVAWTIYKRSESPALSFVIYMGIPYFLLIFSGLRQAIAVGLCFWAFSFVQSRKPIPFVLLVLLANAFHSTAILFLVIYPAYYFRPSIKMRWASLFILSLVYIHADFLFDLLAKYMDSTAISDNTGAINLFLVFCLIYTFCITIMKNGGVQKRGYRNMLLNKDDEIGKQQGYLNVFWFACAMQAFGGVYSLALRLAYYYIIILVLLLPSAILHMSRGKLILIKGETAPATPPTPTVRPVPSRMSGEEYLRYKSESLKNCKLKATCKRFGQALMYNRASRYVINFWRAHRKTIILWVVVVCFTVSGLHGLARTYWSMSYPYYFFWQTV